MRERLLTGHSSELALGYAQVAIDSFGHVAIAGQVDRREPRPALRDQLDEATQRLRNLLGAAGHNTELVGLRLFVSVAVDLAQLKLALRAFGPAGAALTVIPVRRLASPDYLLEVAGEGASGYKRRCLVP